MKRTMARIDVDELLLRIGREGAGALLTRGEAAAMIASRVRSPQEAVTTARNRIAMQLDRSRNRGNNVHVGGGLAAQPDGRYTIDEIARWCWVHLDPGLFKDLPTVPRDIGIATAEDCLHFSVRGKEQTFPGSLEDSHRLIAALRAQQEAYLAEAAAEKDRRRQELGERFKKKPK